jgi:ATP-dependent DNA helicase RecG
MALPVGIEVLLRGRAVESSRIEYKGGWNPAECIRTICAFANDIDDQDGGYLIIGVDERDGRPQLPPRGVSPDSIDRIEKDLLNKCHFIEPFYHPRVEVCEYEGVLLLVLWVPAGGGRPYKASKDVFKNQGTKVFYIRRGSSTIEADGDSLRELFDRSSRIPFDDRENPFASVEDIDKDLVREHLRRVDSTLYDRSADEPLVDLARDMRLVTGPRENLLPRNVALLMFSRDPQRFFPAARIEVVDMPRPTGQGMTEKTFEGPLQSQLENALVYIRSYMLEETIDKGEDGLETARAWNYPPAAVKEALANAVYHRDYRISEPITVVKTLRHIEIKSFPGLDCDLQVRSAGEYRNRRVGNFLKELGLTEGRNTGVPTMVESLRLNGSPDPLFMMDEERRSLTVRIPVHPAFIGEADEAPRRGRAPQRTRGELKASVLSLLSGKPLSARGLAAELGYGGVTAGLRDVLGELRELGLVEVSGRGRSTVYSRIR